MLIAPKRFKATDFKFDIRVPRDSPDMTPKKTSLLCLLSYSDIYHFCADLLLSFAVTILKLRAVREYKAPPEDFHVLFLIVYRNHKS